jgi:hypothetical protein
LLPGKLPQFLNNEEKVFNCNRQSEDYDPVEEGYSKKRHCHAYWLSCEDRLASYFGKSQPPKVEHSDQEKGFWKAQKDVQVHLLAFKAHSYQESNDCKGNQESNGFGARKCFSPHNSTLSAEGPETAKQVCCHEAPGTDKMRKKRVAFAKKFQHWTPEQQGKLMFSDESTFRMLRAVQSKVRRPIGSYLYSSHYTVKTMKHPDSMMVWACFTRDFKSVGLYFLPKNVTMNGERYKEVLENHLLPFMEIHRVSHFLQDGAPCHTTKKVKEFL